MPPKELSAWRWRELRFTHGVESGSPHHRAKQSRGQSAVAVAGHDGGELRGDAQELGVALDLHAPGFERLGGRGLRHEKHAARQASVRAPSLKAGGVQGPPGGKAADRRLLASATLLR